MNIFDELLHRLSSKTRIRQLFKDVDTHDLERIFSRMKGILVEKQEEREQEESSRQAKIQSIGSIKQLMADHGVSLQDLGLGDGLASKRRRNVQKFTFQYEDENGDISSWDGATTGRLPRDFQAYLARTGKKRMDCAVENTENE